MGGKIPPIEFSGRTRTAIVAALSAGFLILAIFSIQTGLPWIGRTFPGFVVMRNNMVPVAGVPGWTGFEKGIKFGDIVTAADGNPLTRGDDLNAYVAAKKPGTPVAYTIRRGGEELTIAVPAAEFTRRDWLLMFPVMIFFGAALYIMGLVVFALRPNEPAARAFVVNGVLVGATLAGVPEYVTGHHNLAPAIGLCLIGPSFVSLGCYFPEAHRRRKIFLAIAYGGGIPLAIAYVITFFMPVAVFHKVDLAMQVFISLTNTLGIYLVGDSFYHSKDPLTRQKTKLMVFGICLTTMGTVVFVIGVLILKIMPLFWFLPVALFFMPVSIAYGILSGNLFDVDALIRRGVSYVIVSAAAAVVFFGLIALFSFLLQGLFQQSTQLAAVGSTIVAVAMFRPLANRVDSFLDRRFFREKTEYQNTIRRASRLLVSIVELGPLTQNILDTMIGAMKIERGIIVLKSRPSGAFEPAAARGISGPVEPMAADHPLIQRLERVKYAIQKNELQPRRPGDPIVLRALDDLSAVLAVPAIYEKQLTGVLLLGEKKSGAWYSGEDIEMIQTLMLQTAVSIENARKVEELKKMVQLESSYRELQAIAELKDNLLHMVSHDLRTPMTGILGYAYLLRQSREEFDAAAIDSYLDIIIHEGERMTRLINDLLDLQRFEAGRMELEMAPLDLAKAAYETVSVFRAAAETKGVSMSAELPACALSVLGHRDRLVQTMGNLISNAIKFTPAGGQVRVKAEKVENGGRSWVRVTVSDTGEGIPPAIQPLIFSKFQQAHQEMRKGGSGLGLALVREIVRCHGGEVGFSSRPGQGSDFFFTLPLKDSGAEQKPPF